MGLNDLAKKDVENVFTQVLNKFENVDDFLNIFEDVLRNLYNHKDYKGGGWNQDKIDNLLRDYEKRTDAIKKDYRDKKIVHLTGSSVTVVGGILSMTPLAPVGWGLVAAGSSMSAVTDIVDLADKKKQKAWEEAKTALKDYVEHPFRDNDFNDIYDGIIKAFLSIENKIANDDFTVVLQGLGWNYFLFRSQGYDHDVSINRLKDICELFRTHRYTISTKLRNRNGDAIKDVQNTVTASCNDLVQSVAALGLIGISAGIGVGAVVAGINVANMAFRSSEALAHVLLSIGNGALRFVNTMSKVAPVLAIVGGVASIVINSKAIHDIDKTFKTYYDFKDECERFLNQCREEYEKTDVAIKEMYKFMTEDKSEKKE